MKQNTNNSISNNKTDLLTFKKSCHSIVDLSDDKIQRFSLILNDINQKSEKKNKRVEDYTQNHMKKINLNHFPNLTTRESFMQKRSNYKINLNNPIKSNDLIVNKNNQTINCLVKQTKINFYKDNNKNPIHINIPKPKKSFKSDYIENNNFSNLKKINKCKIIINKKQNCNNLMENCDGFLYNKMNKSTNFNFGNNKANKFLNLNISKTELKTSNLINIKESLIKRNSKYESEVVKEKLEIEVLNTTNDLFTDENDNSPEKEVDKKGNWICRNRIIEPILSTKKGFVDNFGESNYQVSNFNLPNSQKKRNLINCSKSPIKENSINDYHDFYNSNNNSKVKFNIDNKDYSENKDKTKFAHKIQINKDVDPVKMKISNLLINKKINNSLKNQININNKMNNKSNAKENQILDFDNYKNNSNTKDFIIQKANGKNTNDNYSQNNMFQQKEKDFNQKSNDDWILLASNNQNLNKFKNKNFKDIDNKKQLSDKEKLEYNLLIYANSNQTNNLNANYFSNNNQETSLKMNCNNANTNNYVKIMNKLETDNGSPLTNGDIKNQGNSDKISFNKTKRKVLISEENKNNENNKRNISNLNRNMNINLKPELQYNFKEESDDSLDELDEKNTFENIHSKIIENKNLQYSYTDNDNNFNYLSKGLESLKESNEIKYVKKFLMLSDDSLNRFVNKAKIALKQNTINNYNKNCNYNNNNYKNNNNIISNESCDEFNLEENFATDSNYFEKNYNLLNSPAKNLSKQLLRLKEKKEEIPFKANQIDKRINKDDYSTNFKSENRFIGNENLDLSLSKNSKDLGKTKINKNQKQDFDNNIGFKTFPINFFKNLCNKGIINKNKGILSKSNINIDNLHSKFSNDIDSIIVNLRNKNKKSSKDKIITNHADRKKSSNFLNKETNSNTSSLCSEGITSGKTEEKITSISDRRLEILKKNLEIFKNAKYNVDKIKDYGKITRSVRYDNEKNALKIKKIQCIFRGYLFRKLYRKCFKNYENLNKLIVLFLQISNENKNRIKKLFFINFRAKFKFLKYEDCKMLLNFLHKFLCKKRKAYKEFFLRKFYLNSFTKKISNDLEKEKIKQTNQSIENQKTQFLQAQKEKVKHDRCLKLLIFIANFSNLKIMRNKTILFKQLKNIQIAKNLEEQRKISLLKKMVLYYNRKNNLKNSQKYFSLYLKVFFIDWKNRSKKTIFSDKMILRNFLLEKILLKKVKRANDEKDFLELIKNKNEKIGAKLNKENLYFNPIKHILKTLLAHMNKMFFLKINLENKSTKILFALQKLFFNKENKEKSIKKNYLNKLREFAINYKIKIINKQKDILQVLIKKYIQIKELLELKATLSTWRDNSLKLLKLKEILLKILSIKLNKSLLIEKHCFEKYKTKAKKLTNHLNSFSKILEIANTLQNRIKLECCKKILNKLKILAKWKNYTNDLKIININCSLYKETYENHKNSFSEEVEIFKEKDNQEVLLETNIRFKRINYLWKMSNKKNYEINFLRYYLFKFYNKTKTLFLEDLKQNSIKWNYITYYNNTNYRNKSDSEDDENEEILEAFKESFTKQNMIVEKSNIEANFAANTKKLNQGNKFIPNVFETNIIAKQESGVNDVLIINKYKRSLLKDLGIQNLSQNNISFETTKRTDIPLSEKPHIGSNRNSEISNISKCILELEIPKNDFSLETDISIINKKNNLDNNFAEEAENNKDKQLKEYQHALNILQKIFKFKMQEMFFVLLRQLRYVKFNKFATLITKSFKKFLKNIREKEEMKKEEIKFNNLKSKLVKFTDKIENICIKMATKHLILINKEDISQEIILTGNSNISFEIDINNKNYNNIKLSRKSRNISKTSNSSLKPNSNKKSSTSHKQIPKLAIFSFDVNLSTSYNINNQPSPTIVKKNSMLVTDNAFNSLTNRTSINFESNNKFRKNFYNQSFSQNQTYNNYNTCNTQSVVYSKNLTFNSELKSDEEPDEINEIKISCAIEIQNFWRDYKIQQYILALVDKMKYLDKLIKRKNYKLKNSKLISFIKWKKKIFIIKIIEKAKLIQRFFRKRKFRKNNISKQSS